MRTTAILLLAGLLLPRLALADVRCDRSRIDCGLEGDVLPVSLDTGLPDDTQSSITINREYTAPAWGPTLDGWRKGADTTYNIDYYRSDGTVGAWRKAHRVEVSDSRFQEARRKHQKEMAKLGMGVDVGRISRSIGVSIGVSINESLLRLPCHPADAPSLSV